VPDLTADAEARLEGERADHDWPAVLLRAVGIGGLPPTELVLFAPADLAPGGDEYKARPRRRCPIGCSAILTMLYARLISPTRAWPTGVAAWAPPRVVRLVAGYLRVLSLAACELGIRPR
jgi:hypothetical protein